MANAWFRMYAEFATDPKVQILSESLQRRYIMLLCLRCNISSNDNVTLHETLSDENIAFQLRISNDDWLATKSILISKNLIDDHNIPTKWDKRQFISDSSAERVKRHREKKKQGCNVTVTPPDTDTDTDTDTDKEKNINKKRNVQTISVELMIESVEGLSKEIAQEYFDYRRGKKKPLTERAWKGICKTLNEFKAIGGNPEQALSKAMEKDWIGLELEWLQKVIPSNVLQFQNNQQERLPKGMSLTKVEGWFHDGFEHWKDPKLFDEATGKSWYSVYLSDKRRVPAEMIPEFELRRYGSTS